MASDIEGVYLSRSACIDLGLIHKHFPAVGQFAEDNTESFIDYDVNNKDDSMYQSIYSIQGKQCNCPRRELPPQPPKELPFPATAENREKLGQWIIDKYASSAFNQCEHQPLPLMKGSPPIKLHVNPEAEPVAIHKARPVPVHWRDKVLAELERDVRIGVLERVPIGEPTTW